MSQVSDGSTESVAAKHEVDPYTIGDGVPQDPPKTLASRLRHLGPSVIVAGSIVGSGEILLTSGLGAVAGFALIWWVLLSCWSKSIVQAELTRYCITSGDTYMRALNRLPLRIPGPKQKVSWPVWLAVIAFIPGVTGLGGIVGGAGQGLALLFDGLDSRVGAAIAAFCAILILSTNSYRYLERIMIVLVMGFTVITIFSSGLMQFTEFKIGIEDLLSGLSFQFPLVAASMAIAMYGYTGVTSGEIAAYTYWCVEKGYTKNIGSDHSDPAWVDRARGWLKVLHADIWLTLIILTCATLPFYFLGAGVLHTSGLRPEGLQTIEVLSNMFTGTLGEWSLVLFAVGAFFILFSTTLSGVGAGGRVFPDYVIEFGFIPRTKIRRKRWTIGYVIIIPLLALALYMFYERPIALIMIGAFFAAITLPIQSGATLYLQSKHMDQRIRPRPLTRFALWLTFIFQLLMAAFVIWVTFWPESFQ